MIPTQKVVIEEASGEHLRLKVDGIEQLIAHNQEVLTQILTKLGEKTFQVADKIYNIQSIDQATFGLVMDKSNPKKELPTGLRNNLFTENNENIWVQSLRQALLDEGVSVRRDPFDIFQHFGWLIEVFLRKVISDEGAKRTLNRLAYMAEVFQSSLRYLCYIQLSKSIADPRLQLQITDDFFSLAETEFSALDLSHLLLQSTRQIAMEDSFMPELYTLSDDFLNNNHDLRDIVQFLDSKRGDLILGKIKADDKLNHLLDEYLTALVTWLRRIAFVARYRMVSIKDIKLQYRLGSGKKFVHQYGILHGRFEERYQAEDDFDEVSVDNDFTYNHSVLLFKGTNIGQSMEDLSSPDTYLSLTPLLIDYSVFTSRNTHTPDVCYFAGQAERQYHYHQAGNELPLKDSGSKRTNKTLTVSYQNNRQPKLNALHQQLTTVQELRNA